MAGLLPLLAAPSYSESEPLADEVLQFSLEDILNVEVTSASKKKESLASVASAMFVISGKEIKQTGVTNIPDALRMVPGLQVAKIDSNKWAVSSRGFNGRFTNKLLVMIDGRTVYSPSFSGVYWDMQDIMLEDIERIEVIRGPGGTVWGANAVNGVINIITKHTADSQSNFVSVGAGNYEKAFLAARTGGKIADNSYGRLSFKANKRDNSSDQAENKDHWDSYRLAGRIDIRLNTNDSVSVSTEYYRGNLQQTIDHAIYSQPYSASNDEEAEFSGFNVLTRWDHHSNINNNWSLQFYIDQTNRDEFLLEDNRKTYDIDFTQRLKFSDNHSVVWGLNYRLIDSQFESSEVINIQKEQEKNELYSAFSQLELILLPDQLAITLGTKLERNDFTGNELQPSLKLNWTVNSSTQLWSSISKAVRTPSLAEKNFDVFGQILPPPCSSPPAPSCPPGSTFPIKVETAGTEAFQSEELIAYEIGLRLVPTRDVNLDISLFYNDYTKLRSFEVSAPTLAFTPVPHLVSDALFVNKVTGNTQGLEIAFGWKASEKTNIDLAYNYINTDIDWLDPIEQSQNTAAPKHQLSLRANYDIKETLNLNLWVRHVENHTVIKTYQATEIEPYTTLDLHFNWQLTPTVSLSLVGQNLLDKNHLEYIQESFIEATEIERSFYANIAVEF